MFVSAVTSSEPVLDLIGEPEASCRFKPLRMGIPEGLSAGGGPGESPAASQLSALREKLHF